MEERFTAPSNWKTGTFNNPDTGHSLHYGYVTPENPKAIVVCLGGLSEFSEKYFELARDMLARGYAFWTMDWAYQGRSSRLAGALFHRRHSDGYESDISDLHVFVEQHVRRTSGQLPLIMMAHSMGANMGLRYLLEHPNVFKAAAFTAPLLGIKHFPLTARLLLNILYPFFPQSYVPMGSNWKKEWRKSDGTDKFSTDSMRDTLHNAYSLAEEVLQVGNPTLGWVYKSLHSCGTLNAPGVLEKIDIPMVIAMAGQEEIVCNRAIRTAVPRMKNATLLELEGARHEIFMEKDEYRGRLLDAFDKMVKDYKIVT